MSKITWDDKVPAVGDDPSAWTPEMKVSASDMNSVKDSVNTLYNSGGATYKSIVGLLSFNSTTSEVSVIELFNNLGPVEWSVPSDGQFRCTSSGLFKEHKTWGICTPNPTGPYITVFNRQSDNFARLMFYYHDGTITVTPAMTDSSFEIRVYD